MNYERTTQVPNILFDQYLQVLNLAELKLLLIIIRQTNGWVDKRTGNRKVRDRISHRQFITKTKLSRRAVSSTIQALVLKDLIEVTDSREIILSLPSQRKGRQYLFYKCKLQHVQKTVVPNALQEPRPEQKRVHNKTNLQKNKTTNLNPHAKYLQRLIEDIKISMQL